MAKSRKPNKLFRAAREHLFDSREALAEAVNAHLPQAYEINANDVGKIERGIVTYPRPPRRSAFRKVLRVGNDAEIGFFDSRHSMPQSDGLIDGSLVPRPRSTTCQYPPTIQSVDGWNLHIGLADDDDQNRPHRLALQNLASLSFSTPVPSAIGWADVEHVRFITRALALSENTYGGGFSGQAAAAHLRHSARLVDAHGSEDVRRGMYEAVGNLSGVVGFSAFDVSDYQSARTCFDFELWCAKEARSWPLRASALGDMARLSMYLGKNDDALSLIEFAQVRADRLSATTRAMLCAVRARLLALQGRHEEAQASVAQADVHFCDRNPSDDPPWISYYDEAEHQGSTARALLPIAVEERNVEIVVPRLERAILLHDDDHPRSRAFSRTRLASLLMKIGDPREAAKIGSIVIREASTLRSARLRYELECLALVSVEHKSVPDVAELRHAITDSDQRAGAQ